MPNDKAALEPEPIRLDDLDRALPPERAAKLLEEYEADSPTRRLRVWPARVAAVLAIALSACALYSVVGIIPA